MPAAADSLASETRWKARASQVLTARNQSHGGSGGPVLDGLRLPEDMRL